MDDPEEMEQSVRRLEGLLARVEAMTSADGEIARGAVSALAEVYGEALARAVSTTREAPEVALRMAADPLVGHLLALHGIHPVPVEERVAEVMSEMRIRLGDEGVPRLEGIEDGVARVAVPSKGCGSQQIEPAVRDILLGAAPDLAGVETAPAAPPPGFVPLAAVRSRGAEPGTIRR